MSVMKTIFMLLYGSKYSYRDVNNIVDSTNGQGYNYVLYCDSEPSGLDPKVKTVTGIDPELGTFNKLMMFEGRDIDQCLYLDLDVVIQNPNLDDFFDAGLERPTICKTYWKPEGFEAHIGGGDYNSSVIAWSKGNGRSMFTHFSSDPDRWLVRYRDCDDKYLYHVHGYIFAHFPKGSIYSYAYGIDYETDTSPRGRKHHKGASICLLNGQDRHDFNLRIDYYSHFSNDKVG